MSESGKSLVETGSSGYANLSAPTQRSIAVAAALELIQTRLGASSATGVLEAELAKLASYADTIQAALKV